MLSTLPGMQLSWPFHQSPEVPGRLHLQQRAQQGGGETPQESAEAVQGTFSSERGGHCTLKLKLSAQDIAIEACSRGLCFADGVCVWFSCRELTSVPST